MDVVNFAFQVCCVIIFPAQMFTTHRFPSIQQPENVGYVGYVGLLAHKTFL
jgi:hypothetical protein